MFVQRSRLSSPLNLPRWLSVQVWSGVDGRQTLSTIQQSGLSRSLPEWLSPLFKSAFLWRDRLEGTKVEWRFGCEHIQSQNFLTDFCFAFSLHLSNYKEIENQHKLETKQCTEKYNILPKIHWMALNYLEWLEVAITPIILLMHVQKGSTLSSIWLIAKCNGRNQIENFHLMKDFGRAWVHGSTIVG